MVRTRRFRALCSRIRDGKDLRAETEVGRLGPRPVAPRPPSSRTRRGVLARIRRAPSAGLRANVRDGGPWLGRAIVPWRIPDGRTKLVAWGCSSVALIPLSTHVRTYTPLGSLEISWVRIPMIPITDSTASDHQSEQSLLLSAGTGGWPHHWRLLLKRSRSSRIRRGSCACRRTAWGWSQTSDGRPP